MNDERIMLPARIAGEVSAHLGLFTLLVLQDLRHINASVLLGESAENGVVRPKVASAMLGHSPTSLTLDTHAHVMPQGIKEAASVFDRAARQNIDRKLP